MRAIAACLRKQGRARGAGRRKLPQISGDLPKAGSQRRVRRIETSLSQQGPVGRTRRRKLPQVSRDLQRSLVKVANFQCGGAVRLRSAPPRAPVIPKAASVGGLVDIRPYLQCRLVADIVAKVFLGWRTKILGAADALYARQREGPYCFIQNRSRTSAVALKSDAAAEKSKDQLSRDFPVVRFSTFATISARSGHFVHLRVGEAAGVVQSSSASNSTGWLSLRLGGNGWRKPGRRSEPWP